MRTAARCVGRRPVSGLRQRDHLESIKRFNEGRDWLVHSVSLFGEGHGARLSRMAPNGERLAQRCYLIEFDHSVHDFVSCGRGPSQQFITLP